MTSLFPPFNRRSSFRKQPYFYEAGRGVNYKSTGGPFPTLDLNFLSGTLDPRITFSRASNAMVTDSTGKITYAPNNLALYSQDFSNWTADGANVTSATETAPDGTATATLLTAASGNYRRYRLATFTAGVSYIASVYVKQGTAATIQTDVINQVSGPVFTFSSLTYSGGVGVTNHTVTSVGNGWYRLSFKFTANSTSLGMSIAMNGATVGQTVYAWGQQAEAVTYQTSPSTYNATTTAAYYGPRFDYDPVTLASKGLLIEEQRTNVLTYSEQVDNAAWTKGAASISANATPAPDGTSTADKLVEDNTTSVHQVNQAVTTTAIAYTFSVYLKAAGRNWAILGITDSGSTVRLTWFDLANGAVGTVGTNITASITPVGNSWYRCSVTVAAAVAGFNTFRIYTSTGNNTTTYTGDGTSGIFVWGAQSEAGSFATSYIPTVASSVTRSADIASMTGSNFSSWFNQGPVNLLLQSQTFNTSWIIINSSVSADSTTAPDGTTTADTITPNTTGGTSHRVHQGVSCVPGATYTLSVYAKPNGYNFIVLYATGGSGPNDGKYFDISTGVVGGDFTGPPLSSSITSVGNGWYRCSITFENAAQSSFEMRIYAAPSDGGINFAGDGTSGIYLWGAQLELGSTATSYIPTTTAPVASPPAVGTFWTQFDGPASGTRAIVAADNNTASNNIQLYTSATDPKFLIANGGVTQADIDAGLVAATTQYKFVGAFATDNFAASISGGAAVTDTSGSMPAVDRFRIGTNQAGNYLNGHVAAVRYYNQRLSDAKLQILTS